MGRTAVIIGAGPAGLTAAYELLTRTDVVPLVLERTGYMGGISRTVNYKGNRIDIGGHRFFSKSDRVVQWWLQRLALEQSNGSNLHLTYQNQSRDLKASGLADPQSTDRVMLIRSRKSRIYFRRKFFDYPLSLSVDTLSKLGLFQTMLIGVSYCKSMLFPIKPEENLEQFFINRFGRRLYLTFFKSYTEKVWGVPCHEISAEWGAQRVKGLSILKAISHMVKQMKPKKHDLAQKDVETSLIEWFLYPKFGPGQVWEETAGLVQKSGGQILTEWKVNRVCHAGGRVTSIEAVHASGEKRSFTGDFFFSTMPVKDLVRSLDPAAPAAVREVAEGLMYRDFITVGLLCKSLKLSDAAANGRIRIKDNWIYIQEPDALVGRLQIFNNWSPYMVADPNHTWIGLEYFCNEGDELWRKSDAEMMALAKEEMSKLDIVEPAAVLDATVIRMEKTYPAYFGSYDRFPEIRQYLDQFENLFLVGRNGMHKYNNQDHSMLTAMVAVDNIAAGVVAKDSLWSVNTEQEYHESK
jgi:protoporphyrinogen oxidase